MTTLEAASIMLGVRESVLGPLTLAISTVPHDTPVVMAGRSSMLKPDVFEPSIEVIDVEFADTFEGVKTDVVVGRKFVGIRLQAEHPLGRRVVRGPA